jgi:hypothetical protein
MDPTRQSREMDHLTSQMRLQLYYSLSLCCPEFGRQFIVGEYNYSCLLLTIVFSLCLFLGESHFRNFLGLSLSHVHCDKDCGVGIERYVIRIRLRSSSRGEGTVE